MVKKLTLSLIAVLFLSVPNLFADETHDAHGLVYEPKSHEIISLEELKQKLDNREPLKILDARDQKSYESMHIPGAVLPMTSEYYREETLYRMGIVRNAPDMFESLKTNLKSVKSDEFIVTYCNDNCNASIVLLNRLKQMGYSNVRAMKPGIQSWQAKGYPVSQTPNTQ